MIKKKLVIIWDNILYGGMNTFIENLINNKIFKNMDISLLTNNNNQGIQSLKKNIYTKNFKLITYYSFININIKNFFIKCLYLPSKPFFLLISFIQVFLILKKKKPDIIISACGGYGNFRVDSLSLIAGRLINIKKRILSIHHSYTKPILWQNFLRLIDYFIFKNTTKIIFGSFAVKKNIFKKTILKNFKIKNQVIHHGVSFKRIKKNNSNIDKIFNNKTKEKIKIGILSRVEKNKGHYDFIEAFNLLEEKIKNKFFIFFIGPINKIEKNKISLILKKKKLRKYFKITGYLNFDSFEIIKKLDLLLSLTKTFEGFGLSVAEALALGKPIIATKVGAITEFLNKKNSKLINHSNTFEIKRALEEYIIKNKIWKKNAKIGSRLIKKKFTSDKTALSYYKNF